MLETPLSLSLAAAQVTPVSRGLFLSAVFSRESFAVLLSSGKNATAANIGPIQMPPLEGVDGGLLVIGSRSDDWTSVATFPAGAFITWEEIFENSSTLGNDGGIVVALGTWSGQPPANPADQTFVVTGGGAAPGQYYSIGIIPAITTSGSPNLAAHGHIRLALAPRSSGRRKPVPEC